MSAVVSGATEIDTTGAGNSIMLRWTGWSSSQMVSPVRVWARPTTATMSPVCAVSMFSEWFACMRRMRPMRWLLSRVLLSTFWPDVSVPE